MLWLHLLLWRAHFLLSGVFDHASCPPVRTLAVYFWGKQNVWKSSRSLRGRRRSASGLNRSKPAAALRFSGAASRAALLCRLTAGGQSDGLRSDGSSADRDATKREEHGPVSGHPHLSEQGRFQSKTASGVNNLTRRSLILLAAVQTCHPEELLHCLLEVIKDIQPGRISDTILAALPHLQAGITRGGKSIHFAVL